MRSAGSAVDTRPRSRGRPRRAWSSTDDTTSPGFRSARRSSPATVEPRRTERPGRPGSCCRLRLPGPRASARRRTTSGMASVWRRPPRTGRRPRRRLDPHRSGTSGGAAAGPATTTRSTGQPVPSAAGRRGDRSGERTVAESLGQSDQAAVSDRDRATLGIGGRPRIAGAGVDERHGRGLEHPSHRRGPRPAVHAGPPLRSPRRWDGGRTPDR